MGKDKHTFEKTSEYKQSFYKDLIEHCEKDIVSVLRNGGLQTDLYRECWLKGFQYAGERFSKIFEMLDEELKNEKTKN